MNTQAWVTVLQTALRLLQLPHDCNHVCQAMQYDAAEADTMVERCAPLFQWQKTSVGAGELVCKLHLVTGRSCAGETGSVAVLAASIHCSTASRVGFSLCLTAST